MTLSVPEVDGVPGRLVGRDREVTAVREFLRSATRRGGALTVSGDAGSGKTALLNTAAALARDLGIRVVETAGVQFEEHLTFSGLQQILLPIWDVVAALPEALRDALTVAAGYGDGPAPDRTVVATATLATLERAAAERPLLVIVDDVQWLDRATADVLRTVAARLVRAPVAYLGASRTSEFSLTEGGDPSVLVLAPLTDTDAVGLVRRRFPELAPAVVDRVVAASAGNPLALVEFPVSLGPTPTAAGRTWPAVVSLTQRMQEEFAVRIGGLPPDTGRLLLLAALEGSGTVTKLDLASPGRDIGADLEPAARAGLASIAPGDDRVRFRHPLAAAAVVALATADERRGAHRALAATLVGEDDGDRVVQRAWHVSEASALPDERAAALLEAAAAVVLRRGDAVAAVSTLLRSAALSPSSSDRARRLQRAAYLGAGVTGDLRRAAEMLGDARSVDPTHLDSLVAATAAASVLFGGDGDVDTAHRPPVAAIENYEHHEDPCDESLVDAMYTLNYVCWFSGRPEFWTPYFAALARFRPEPPRTLLLLSETFPDPVRIPPSAHELLREHLATLEHENNPAQVYRIGNAAAYFDQLGACREAFLRVAADGRRGGAVATAISMYLLLSLDDLLTGDWDASERRAREALLLCDTHGYQLLAGSGHYLLAYLAACRGDTPTSAEHLAEMVRWATPRGVDSSTMLASTVRATGAAALGEFDEVFRHATAVSPAGVLPRYAPIATYVFFDIVESAVHTGRLEQARAHVAALREVELGSLSSRMALLQAACEALVSDDVARGFERALALPGVGRWTFDLARVRLAYGTFLRRQLSVAASREQLSAAADAFALLGAVPFENRARRELRATGRTRASGTAASAVLTPQEREIAELAASGLSNKVIAARLSVSPRTVANHLYAAFPKLGVTKRAGLRDALSGGAVGDRPGSAT